MTTSWRARAGMLVALLCVALALLSAPLVRSEASSDTLERLLATPIPPRDPVELYARLHGLDPASIPRVVNPTPPSYELGRVDTFWIGDQNTRTYHQTQATLRYVTPHSYWYVEQGRSISDGAIQHSADFFESRTYPTVHQYFGSEWTPGVDNDPHITILLARVPGVGAYFSSWDEYPRQVYEHSNEREMMDVNLDAMSPGTAQFDGVLAHEFQHMVHWNSNPNDETWVDEGCAELSTNLVLGDQTVGVNAFAAQPDTQLTAWSDQPGETGVHYEAAYLFMRYFIDRFGGPSILHDLIAQHARGTQLFDRYLEATGRDERFPDVFGDFAVANFLNDASVDDGRYAEPSVAIHSRVGATLHPGDPPLEAQVHQFGTDYVELAGNGSDVSVDFSGHNQVRLVGTDPTSGRFLWWSNRGDGMDSTLTRELDLTGVSSATLQFKAWYEIEKNYDYLYVMVSADGGRSWQVLPGTDTSSDNPTGNAVGPGYTGVSGGGDAAVWTNQQVDLSAFAGKKILLRFEYVTDQAYNRSGAALDDIRVPEIGFSDDAEQDTGWVANGFLRSDNHIPQTYQLRLIEWTDRGASVQSIPVADDGSAHIQVPSLGGTTTRAVLAISGTAPATLEVAKYRLEVRAP